MISTKREFMRRNETQKSIIHFRWSITLHLCLGWIGVFGQELIAPPEITPQCQSVVKNLLIDLWDRDLVSRGQAEQLYEKTDVKSRGIVLAYVANRLHHGQVREAIAAVQELLIRDTDFLDGLLVRAHLNLRIRDFDQASLDLRGAVRLLAGETFSDAQKEEALYRVGRMIGFLEGPVQHRTNRDLSRITIDEVNKVASPAQLQHFNRGLQEIADLHNQLAQATQGRFERELQAQERADAQIEQSLTVENNNLTQVVAGLAQQMAQVRDQGAQRESQLAAQMVPLEASLYSLEGRLSAARFEVFQLQSELILAQNAPFVCHITIAWIRDRLRLAELNLFSMQNSYAVAVSQINNINLQIQQASLQTQRQLQNLEQERRQATGRMNRNQRQLARIARGPEVAGGKREAMENRLVSLASYIQLPPTAIRQDLLDQFNQ